MTWARFDDRFHEHRKVRAAWRASTAAIGLHVMAITYCAGHETDGHVDRAFVAEKLPVTRERDRAVTALVTAGLWTEVDDGWVIHDYLKYNPSRERLEEKHRADAERKANGRRSDSRRTPSGLRSESAQTPNGVRAASARPGPYSTPTPPNPPKGGRSRDRQRFDDDMKAWAGEHFPSVPASAVAAAVGRLREMGGEVLVDTVRIELARWHPEVKEPAA